MKDRQSNYNIKSLPPKGFTLAEILLVITIIGIIASSTIPELVTNIQNMQYKAAWKKTYSEINQATMNMMNDNGGNLVNIFANNGLTEQTGFATLFSRYMDAVKVCNTWGTSGQCWHIPDTMNDLGGTVVSGAGFLGMGIILKNGAFMRFHGYGDACTTTNLGVMDCGLIMVDTNGYKRPNTIGKDIYGLHFTKNGILPFGIPAGSGNGVWINQYGDGQYQYSNCSATTAPPNGGTQRGWTCAREYLLN